MLLSVFTPSFADAIALAPLLLGNISPPTTSDGSESVRASFLLLTVYHRIFVLQRTFLAVVNRAVSRLLIQNQGFLAAVKEQYDSPGGTMPFANVLKLVTVRVHNRFCDSCVFPLISSSHVSGVQTVPRVMHCGGCEGHIRRCEQRRRVSCILDAHPV